MSGRAAGAYYVVYKQENIYINNVYPAGERNPCKKKHEKMKHHTLYISLTGTAMALTLGVFLMTPAASADLFTWTGSSGVDNNWTTDGNWDIAGSPDSGDTANIGAGATVDMDDFRGWWVLTINQSGGTITNTTGGTIGSSQSASAWNLTGGTLDANNQSINWTALDGTLNIDGGSVVNANELRPTAGGVSFLSSGSISGGDLIALTPGNTFAMSGGASSWSGKLNLAPGNSGTVTFQISGGTHSFDGELDLNAFNIDDRIAALEFHPGGSGSLSVGSLDIQTDNNSRIDFITGTAIDLTIAGYTATDYESLWDSNDLWLNGQSKSNLSDIAFSSTDFQVTGSTLALIPEPATAMLLGLGLFSINLLRRRSRRG